MRHDEALAQELLEYVYGCHADPQVLEARLAADPALRARLAEVRAQASVLDEAARESAPELELAAPAAARAGALRAALCGTPLRLAASVLFALGLVVPWAWVGVSRLHLRAVQDDFLRLVVSGPSGVPDGAPARFRVETWDVSGDPCVARVAWTALGADGAVLYDGASEARGALDVDLPAGLAGVRRVEVVAERGGIERRAEFALAPDSETPLAHLATDKPLYRPGEVTWLRAVLLDRLSLTPRDGRCRLRVSDPKGAPVQSWTPALEEGVAAFAWQVPDDAAGGQYAFELRDSEDAFTVERLPFEVRRFASPQLAKKVDLARETYAPGESGSAEVRVERMTGGPASGAQVDARLVVDGEETWRNVGTLDAAGRAVFTFTIPERVERGEARFVARVVDGGVIETAVEPFVVPTGALHAAFFPEGGELVAGVSCRVYAEVTDALERPASARGRVVDGAGREVVPFETLHQGRARFTFVPRAGERYRLEFEEPAAAGVALPAVRANAVALRAAHEVTAAGADVRLTVHAPDAGPWIAGAFCRGVLVAQDTFQGAGAHEVALALPDGVAGVLRVTVFDATLRPVAERLVQRASGRAVQVSVSAARDVLLPGEHQVLDVQARDERGRPVSAVLGLAVVDRAVREESGQTRVGLADRTWLVADVEELEHVEEFLGGGPAAARNVDLLLGTRGWRRFGWLDAGALVERYGDEAKRLLVREGRSDTPRVSDERGDARALYAARARTRDARRAATGLSVLLGVIAALLGIGALLRGLDVWRVHPAGFAAGSCALLLVGLFTLSRMPGAPDVLMDAEQAADGLAFAPGAEAHIEAKLFDLMDAGEVLEEQQFWLGAGLRAAGAEDENGAAALFFDDFGVAPKDGAAVDVVDMGFLAEAAQDFEQGEVQRRGRFEARPRPIAYARVYAHTSRGAGGPRTDFSETAYWNALLRTSADGTARVEFDVSDRVTTWQVHVDAHGDGRVGQALASFEAVTPFYMEAALPIELTVGDRVELPVSLVSGDPTVRTARVRAELRGPLALQGELPREVALENGRGRLGVPVLVTGAGAGGLIGLAGEAGGFTDRSAQPLRVVPRGFPHRVSKSGVVRDGTELVLAVPEEYVEGSLRAQLALYPSPLTDLLDGLEGVLQEPNGCFEQASATNYPNVLALAFLDAAGIESPAAASKARTLLEHGYAKLAGYECSEHGYEWFGGSPAHEALTAYGLLEFHDMAQVFDVEPAMLARTRAWLLSRRDGEGGYERNPRALDSFGAAPEPITNAYVTYALAVTGTPVADIAGELDRLEERGLESQDPYEVALAAAALHAAGRGQPADAARERLKTMQARDGGLEGTTSSITRSGSADLATETTALAILAWLDDPGDAAHVQRAMEFLLGRRSGGRFGATQATIQALRAMTAYAREHRRVANAGELLVFVNDYEVARVPFEAGRRDALEVPDLLPHLTPGNNRVRLALTGGNEFPWALDLAYHAEQPADDPDAVIALRTSLAEPGCTEGETLGLDVELENTTDVGQPMTLAIIGLPAGLECPTKVLDDLQDAGAFDLYERRGREVVLYWRDLAPRQLARVHLDLVARIPGATTGPASRAYLYYTPDQQRWAAPLAVEIAPGR
jgi:hypothetical protein